ncbi:uncharacterized protein [Branchiostoma lanceolatum]|uniref:uncharacterized protein n=1 Tax=Branchiostoma lanceolatum TaxID=7740 RepID=UPI0034547090
MRVLVVVLLGWALFLPAASSADVQEKQQDVFERVEDILEDLRKLTGEEDSLDLRVADDAETPAVTEEKEVADDGLITKKGCDGHQVGEEWGTPEHDNCYCQGPDRSCYHVDCLPDSEIARDSNGLWDCPGGFTIDDTSEKQTEVDMLENSLFQLLEDESSQDPAEVDMLKDNIPRMLTGHKATSCSEEKSLNQADEDGEYTLYPFATSKDVALRVYCHDMASGNPKEFLTLPNGPDENYAIVFSDRLAQGWRCTGALQNPYGRAGTTKFSKLRIKFESSRVEVIRDDQTFAQTTGPNEVDYGHAGDCYSWEKGCAKGTFKVDLTGTELALAPEVQWVMEERWPEWLTIYDMSISKDRKVASGRCGGWCGHCWPAGKKMYLVHPQSFKAFRKDYRCGQGYTAGNGNPAICNPAGHVPCCSPHKWCGSSPAHCTCPGCVDYRKEAVHRLKIKTDAARYSGSNDELTVEIFSDLSENVLATTTVSGLTAAATEYSRDFAAANLRDPSRLRLTISGDDGLQLDWIDVYNAFTGQHSRFSCPTGACRLSTDTSDWDNSSVPQLDLDVDG